VCINQPHHTAKAAAAAAIGHKRRGVLLSRSTSRSIAVASTTGSGLVDWNRDASDIGAQS